jgi:hypothetical protein
MSSWVTIIMYIREVPHWDSIVEKPKYYNRDWVRPVSAAAIAWAAALGDHEQQRHPATRPSSFSSSSGDKVSYLIFMSKLSTHRMYDPWSIVSHIWSKMFTDTQMSWIKYNYYYINNVSKNYDDSQRNGTAEDSITPQKRQPGQHIA